MGEQNFTKQVEDSVILEGTVQDINNPVENVDRTGDTTPDVGGFIPETGGTETLEAVRVDEMKAPVTHEAQAGEHNGGLTALLDPEASGHLRTRWNEIQGMFVDDPRTAVQQADTLVAEAVEQITQMFTKEHSSLEGQWNQGNDVSTEDLRKALQRYRSFFNRLVV